MVHLFRTFCPLGLLPFINAAAFQNPPEVIAENGILETTINIDYATITLNGNTINTRLLNDILPGTTLTCGGRHRKWPYLGGKPPLFRF